MRLHFFKVVQQQTCCFGNISSRTSIGRENIAYAAKQKYVKGHVYLYFEKNVKNVKSNDM